MRRIFRQILALSVAVALTTATAQAGSLHDDQDPKIGRDSRIIKVIKQIIRFIGEPSDDGNLPQPPHP